MGQVFPSRIGRLLHRDGIPRLGRIVQREPHGTVGGKVVDIGFGRTGEGFGFEALEAWRGGQGEGLRRGGAACWQRGIGR